MQIGIQTDRIVNYEFSKTPFTLYVNQTKQNLTCETTNSKTIQRLACMRTGINSNCTGSVY